MDVIPWKIVDECVAGRHNTVHASRGYKGHPKCICPRALVLRAAELDRVRILGVQRRNAARENSEKETPAPQWLRAGPWRISALCIARGHNTLLWARGGRTCSEAKCTCPRALYLLSEFKASRRGQSKHVAIDQTATASSAPRVPEPDWSKAMCRRYPRVADGGFDERMTRAGEDKREAAKRLCVGCPLLAECAQWIVSKEGGEPGSWGGVYAGMDQWNRQGYRMNLGYRGRAEKVKL